jgi:predicted O-methyltransferase YrrM
MNKDKIIKDILEIKDGTKYPMYSKKGVGRDRIPLILKKLGFKYGAEIGVFKGEFSKIILKDNPGLKLKCIDIWQDYKRHDDDSIYNYVVEYLKGFDIEMIKGKSLDVAKNIEDNSLDFVYIDADHHFEPVFNDVTEWSKKVKPGGIISGHDYFNGGNCGVKDAIDKYVEINNIDKWYLTRDGRCKSFIWVKK